MKNLFTLIAVFSFCVIEANAQVSKGSFLIGGGASFARSKYNGANSPAASRNAAVSISPTVGYFVIDKLMIGAQDNFNYSWTSGTEYKSVSNSIGPIVRYYFPFGKFAVFPELTASFGFQNNRSDYFNQETGTVMLQTVKNTSNNYSIGLGGTWFVSPNIGLEAVLGYNSYTLKPGDNQPNSSDYSTNRIALNFGLQFYLPNKE